ncbi:MAG TPA: plastocyanin/azurin family copper-binding protein [Solirubrobacterales bacterium]|nr:plastocyanin/azurin family copper-binding protein [Solirubrobacterales bacterium]
MKKALLVVLAIAIASLGLVACGGSDDDTTSSADTQAESTPESGGEAEGGSAGSGAVVDFETPEGSALAYTTDTASAEAGTDTINFTNVQATPHDVAIEDEGGKEVGKTEVISEDTASAKVKLEPGSYTFFCTIPGHREAGMEGTLTVK